MDMAPILDDSRQALQLALELGGPVLLAALVVGLVVGIVQTLTQLHEPTVALVPRLIAVVLVVLALLPWMVGRWVDYTSGLLDALPGLLLSGG